jgi:hypothetical protein
MSQNDSIPTQHNLPSTSHSTCHTDRVSVKLPPLWVNNIELWFLQVEAQFDLANIVSEETKYAHLVSKLEQCHIEQLADILLLPASRTKYNRLKNAIMQRMGCPLDKKREKLFSSSILGDKNPSTLLREMKTLAIGLDIDEKTLKYLWTQQMPKNIQAHLSVTDNELDNLAEIADKLMLVYNTNNGVATVNTNKNNSDLEQTVKKLLYKVDNLTNKLNSQNNGNYNKFNNNNSHFNKGNYNKFNNNSQYNKNQKTFNNFNKNNSNSNKQQHDKTHSYNKQICFYHQKFGNKSRKCVTPCEFNAHTPPKN